MDLAGMFHEPGRKPLSQEELDGVIADAVSDHVLGREDEEAAAGERDAEAAE